MHKHGNLLFGMHVLEKLYLVVIAMCVKGLSTWEPFVSLSMADVLQRESNNGETQIKAFLDT